MSDCEIVLRLNAMGDILLTVPTLRAIASRGVEVHLVINDRWKDLAKLMPANVHLFSGTGSLIKLAARLKSLSPGAVFDLQGKLSTIALRNLINAPITRIYQKRSFTEQLMALRKKYPIRLFDQRPVWQKYAETCGVEVTNPDPSLVLTSEYLDQCRQVLHNTGLKEKKFIFVHPEASKPGKELPQKLLSAIQNASPLPTAVIGINRSALTINTPHLDLRNQFDLYHLPGILSLASAVVSSDSGPMHLARAVNTPLVAVFLQTCPSLGFAPVPGKNVHVISHSLPCKPCSLHGQNDKCPEGTFACRELDPVETGREIFTFLADFI
ncbi:MAG: hypothetical protein EOM80_16635 [Erysipelotrichia bacterium]|nr:hypothetical protein [Erysipelotrichia bacterium]